MSGPAPRGSAKACLLGSSGGSSGKHSRRSANACFAIGAKNTAALMSGVSEDVWWTWGGGPGARVRRALSPGATSQWPPTGRCTVSEPQLLSQQNGYVSNTSCANLLAGAGGRVGWWRGELLVLGLGLEHVPDGAEAALHLWLREGPPVRVGLEGRIRVMRSPQTTPRAERGTGLPEDISGHPGFLPGPGQSSQGRVTSSSGRAVWGGCPRLASAADNKRTLTPAPGGQRAVPGSHLSPRPRHLLASAVWHIIQRGSDFP